MSLVEIYQCFCDQTRLRILNLLTQGPLCVCHFQEVLDEPQVKISKHLGYLKAHGLVEARREANWMVYSLPAAPSAVLRSNLACLQDCVGEDAAFRRDAERLRKSRGKFAEASPICCAPKTRTKRVNSTK
jgi:ArsR family transcriptional regulator, arsenate/arsenite/antimonite-responsive transcriptional repressor